jgi:hypothetical protein
MEIFIDDDLKAVLEFMYLNVSADKLVGIASKVHNLAPILWGHYPEREFLAATIDLSDFKTVCDSQSIASV